MKRGAYGIDAPGLVRGFLLTGLGSAALAAALMRWAAKTRWAGISHWGRPFAALLAAIATYALGMFCYMLWGSLSTKVHSREALLDLIPWTGTEQVLDVGCGRGLLLVGAAHRLTTGLATGLDLWLERDQSGNSASAALQNARLEQVFDRVRVQTGDMRKLPFANDSFDVVLSHWAVHNLEAEQDRARALAEMIRVLRPGGTLLLTDIAGDAEYKAELGRLGLGTVELIIASTLIDQINNVVSFGSFRPRTLLARKS